MSFMTIKKPGWFFRLMILGAQGCVFSLSLSLPLPLPPLPVGVENSQLTFLYVG